MINKIQKIIMKELYPEGIPLEFLCEVETKDFAGIIKILGKPATIIDLLRVLETKCKYFVALKIRKGEQAKILFDEGNKDFEIDLLKGNLLRNQSPEILKEIYKLIK